MKQLFRIASFVFFLQHTLAAQESNDSLSVFDMTLEELMGIKVEVASNVVKDKKKQPATITTITKEQLELSGARTLFEALSVYVPGMFLVEDQDDVIAGMRGLAPDNNSKMLLLINGQNMNTEFFWGPATAVLNNMNFNYIERVEVIRGPGSVVLGQGALLGVINIITKQPTGAQFAKKVSGGVSALYGSENYVGAEAELAYNSPKMSAYFSVAANDYNGQTLRKEGWAADKNNEGYLGGKIADIGTRLHQATNTNVLANVLFAGFSVNLMYFNLEKDLYNFYRDRNVFAQNLLSASGTHKAEFSEKISLNTMVDISADDIALSSVDGYTMGGTHENRAGVKTILNLNNILKSNSLAVGAEYKYYSMGLPNYAGNNFINNQVSDATIHNPNQYLHEANTTKVFGYKSNLSVISLFAENFYTINSHFDVFGAVRYDNHTYWGSHFSPRIGLISTINNNLNVRAAYQEGFRGAVGLHYSGGYRLDGFLRAENFNQIEAANVLDYENNSLSGSYTNIPQTQPEQIKGFEITIDYNLGKKLNINGVGYFNTIENVIDVGVIWEDKNMYTVPNIGTDIAGDWNGYWYFKNTEGSIKQAGFEVSTTFKNKQLLLNASHSLATVVEADNQQLGSMYLTQQQNFKAFPENVSRVNAIALIGKSVNVGFNYLYYYKWYSPSDQKVDANHLLNITAIYNYNKKIYLKASVINLLNQQKLYPMNSNVGDQSLSDGTPSVETTGGWLQISYKF